MRGHNSPRPTTLSTTIPVQRSTSCGRWSRLSSAPPSSVKTPNDVTSPPTTTNGRRREVAPSWMVLVSTTGRTGRTQGEIAVIRPETSPTKKRVAMTGVRPGGADGLAASQRMRLRTVRAGTMRRQASTRQSPVSLRKNGVGRVAALSRTGRGGPSSPTTSGRPARAPTGCRWPQALWYRGGLRPFVLTPPDGRRHDLEPPDGVPAAPVSYTHLRAHETRHDLVC